MGNINNFNGFNCNSVPKNWDDYNIVFTQEFARYTKCIEDSYNLNLGNYYSKYGNDSCYKEIIKTHTLLDTQIILVSTSMANLLAALKIATPSQPNTFDSGTYYAYINNYNQMVDTSKKLDLMFSTGCGIIAIDNNVGVDTSIIGNSLTQQCTGVYLKQFDNGSEFIGTITNTKDIIPT